MAFERIRKVKKELTDVIAMFSIGAGFAIMDTHIIPHVYANIGPADDHSIGGVIPTRKFWKSLDTREKVHAVALYTGGITGLIGESLFYYHHATETNPGVLAFPVATNTFSALQEIYKARKRNQKNES